MTTALVNISTRHKSFSIYENYDGSPNDLGNYLFSMCYFLLSNDKLAKKISNNLKHNLHVLGDKYFQVPIHYNAKTIWHMIVDNTIKKVVDEHEWAQQEPVDYTYTIDLEKNQIVFNGDGLKTAIKFKDCGKYKFESNLLMEIV